MSRVARSYHAVRAVAVAVALAAVMAVGPPAAAPGTAATAPKVAVIVGPAGSLTDKYRSVADLAAAEALRYTPNVVKVYSPRATWSRVKAAISGATIVVYIGQGYGYPSPRSTSFRPSVQNGFALNPLAGANDSTTRYYGESYVRKTRLAPGAVVLLNRVRSASGNSEPGHRPANRSVAHSRIDNYGAGFLAAGASAVIAETSSPAYYIRTIFTEDVSLDAMWHASPTGNENVTSFSSTRRPGYIGRADPDHPTTGYNRSIVGHLSTTTQTVRGGLPAVVAVPSSIDATGATNATVALNAFIRSVPNGSTIVFPAGGYYRLDSSLYFPNRSGLTFEGNGATLKSTGDGLSSSASLFDVGTGAIGIVIRNFNLVGNSATPGVFVEARQHGHAINIWGARNVEIDNVTISNTWGDCVKVAGDTWADTVWFHDSICTRSGRTGVVIEAGRNVTVERIAFDKNGGGVFNIEPYQTTGGAVNVKFINNTSGTHGFGFFYANGAPGSVVENITVSGNVLTGGTMAGMVNIPTRRKNIVFTNNVSYSTAQGPAGHSFGSAVLYFWHIDGLVVTGNIQPLPNGQTFASVIDCTGVTYP